MFLKILLTTTTAKIIPAHDFPNIILFKIFNRINLNFGVALIALNSILLRQIKSSYQLIAVYLFKEDESEDSVGAKPEVIGGEPFP